jgi:hypothetical protein
MIRERGPLRRRLSFTEEELGQLADEFAEYAAEDIADLLGLDHGATQMHDLTEEIAHAIRCAIDELPHERPSPQISLRSAAAETVDARFFRLLRAADADAA